MLRAVRGAAAGCSSAQPWQQLRSLASFTSLPVIDVGALVNPTASPQAKQAVGRSLHEACLNVGFFYATGHGVPAAVTGGVLQAARAWFALPEKAKARIALSPASHYRGWQRLGANVTRYDGGFQRDWHEAIDLYKEVDVEALAAAGLPASPIHGVNPWPQDPAFEGVLRQYISRCLGLGAAIMRGIALGLQLPESYFEGEVAGDSYWVTRVIYYPPLAHGSRQQETGAAAQAAARGSEVERAVQLSCGEHTDYGLLTLVNQEEGVSALQVKNREGRWVAAPPVPGSFVVNIGDMMKVFTNGLYTPTPHRVVNASDRDRVSIPFFYEANYEASIGPHPHFCGDRPAQFAPMRYGSHLESKVLNNFDLEEGGTAAAAGLGQG